MRDTLKQLQTLQELDVVVHKIKQQLEELPKRTTELEDQLREKTDEINEHMENLKAHEAQKSDREKLLFIEQEKLKRTRTRLTGTNVRNTSAYYANQREIEKLKKDTDDIETVLLESMENIENLKSNVENLETEIKKIAAERDKTTVEVEHKTVFLQRELEEEIGRRGELAALIDPSTLALYERIQGRFPGAALCRATNELCTGCHMHIPPQLYNEVQRAEKIITCPGCLRILFYQDEEDASAEAAGS